MNLKWVLMTLGNRLVTECHCDPPIKEIEAFTRWLNDNEEARNILADLGVEWPVVNENTTKNNRRS